MIVDEKLTLKVRDVGDKDLRAVDGLRYRIDAYRPSRIFRIKENIVENRIISYYTNKYFSCIVSVGC